MKRVLALFVTMIMCAALLVCAGTAETAAEGSAVILFTNDVHCGVDDAIGYAGLAAYRNQLEAEGNAVILVDVGDAVQGAPMGTLSDGEYLIEIMNNVGYDLAVPGNHEFDYGMEQFFKLEEMAEFPYLSVNFTSLESGEAVFDGSYIMELNGLKIGFVGVCTPETITSAAPVHFQNEAGEYIYGFQHSDQTGKALYECVQAEVDELNEAGVDYVVLLAHLGIDYSSSPWTSTEVIENTRGIDAVLDGHSHSVIEQEKVKNLDGEEVLLCSTGTKLNAIGYFEITADGEISTGLVTEYAEKDPQVDAFVKGIQAELDGVLNQVVAITEVDLIAEDPETGIRIVRLGETNLGNLCADAYRELTGADVAIVNGGGIRANIMAGEITYSDIINVHPFGNELCMIKTTGQDIIDTLEIGAMGLPSAEGAFLQVSGMSYEVDVNVPSPVILDENNIAVAIEGERRIRNVMINGEPIDPEATYTLASHSYIIKDGGAGHLLFEDDELILDCIMLDNQVLITYITETLGGIVGEEYAEPAGLITVIQAE